jgi:glycosyltransferase involved in cell wall biosynthesis
VVIPVYNDAAHLRTCLNSLQRSVFHDYECIVVDDGSVDDTPKVAREFGAALLNTGGRKGPACARNTGAASANGEILLFIDCDVCVRPDTLERVAVAFAEDPKLDALIGSYDDDPGSSDFISKYRNLMHCYVHRHGRRKASTFWGGCGAIRRAVFEEVKGFDESYTRPSVEDIELGYRLSGLHKKVLLEPDLMVKHLKQWTFREVIRTDILRRGIPWTELILRYRTMPDDLNLKLSQRMSVLLVFLAVVMASVALFHSWRTFGLSLLTLAFLAFAPVAASSDGKLRPGRALSIIGGTTAIVLLSNLNHAEWVGPMILVAWILLMARRFVPHGLIRRVAGIVSAGYLLLLALSVVVRIPQHPAAYGFYASVAILILLNADFYLFLAARMGKLHALAAIPLHMLFFFYSGVASVLGVLKYLVRPQSAMIAGKTRSQSSSPSVRAAPDSGTD